MPATEMFQVGFVESVPKALEQGTLYVSMRFATVIHLCACGCGSKTVTPLDPAAYKLIYDGDTITLSPSIGNWQYPCRSHYFIRRNEVVWASDMTEAQIAHDRRRNRGRRAAALAEPAPKRTPGGAPLTSDTRLRRTGVISRIVAWLRR